MLAFHRLPSLLGVLAPTLTMTTEQQIAFLCSFYPPLSARDNERIASIVIPQLANLPNAIELVRAHLAARLVRS